MEPVLAAAIAALGAKAGSPAADTLLTALRALGEVRARTMDRERLHQCDSAGVSVIFEDDTVANVQLRLLPIEGCPVWSGPLPLGVDARMAIREVIARLGQPIAHGGAFQPHLRYALPEGRTVTFVFRDQGKRMDRLVLEATRVLRW